MSVEPQRPSDTFLRARLRVAAAEAIWLVADWLESVRDSLLDLAGRLVG